MSYIMYLEVYTETGLSPEIKYSKWAMPSQAQRPTGRAASEIILL